MSTTKSKILSILFVASRPVKLREFTSALDKTAEEVKQGLAEIKSDLRDKGINLLEHAEKYQLVTNPVNSKIITDFLNAELREKLTDAALETLSIILYKQPVTRAEIEAIRGVNSQYILRHLLIRGLIEKNTSKEDSRRLVYITTLEFMNSLGIVDLKDLPDFEELTKSVTLPDFPQEIKT